jgi:hypothetical protein
MPGGAGITAGYPEPPRTGVPTRTGTARFPEPDATHRTRTNTRTSLEPIGYDSEGAPLYAWQLDDER